MICEKAAADTLNPSQRNLLDLLYDNYIICYALHILYIWVHLKKPLGSVSIYDLTAIAATVSNFWSEMMKIEQKKILPSQLKLPFINYYDQDFTKFLKMNILLVTTRFFDDTFSYLGIINPLIIQSWSLLFGA